MARIRTIKPSFFKHGDLFDAERASGFPLRVAFAGLWTVADREGRFKWRPREIKVEVLPYDDVDMNAVMTALVDAGLILRYAVNGQEYGAIPTFSEHQHINPKEPESNIPAPVENRKKYSRTSPTRQEGKGREGKGISISADAFEEFWGVCPRKVGKGKAKKLFDKACEAVSSQALIDAMRRYAATRKGEEPKYTAHPATWLHQERWNDELPGSGSAKIYDLSAFQSPEEQEAQRKLAEAANGP